MEIRIKGLRIPVLLLRAPTENPNTCIEKLTPMQLCGITTPSW